MAKPKSAEELDDRFDQGEGIVSLGFDLSKATRPGLESLRPRSRELVARLAKLANRAKPETYFMNETTLVLLKPDCLAQRHAGDVLQRFEHADLEIVGCKMTLLSDEVLAEHYAHVSTRPFYPGLKAFMQSSPVIVLALAGVGAVAKVRDLMGPTDSKKAAAGTIRGDFGADTMENVVHGSDSPESAAAELKRFFAPDELFRSALHPV